MNSEKYLSALGALFLVWSMRGEAHDSHEAVMEGGNLMQLTRALFHPVLEIPYLPAFLISTLILGLVLGPVILHITRQRNSSKLDHPAMMETPAIPPKTDNL